MRRSTADMVKATWVRASSCFPATTPNHGAHPSLMRRTLTSCDRLSDDAVYVALYGSSSSFRNLVIWRTEKHLALADNLIGLPSLRRALPRLPVPPMRQLTSGPAVPERDSR